MTLSTIGLDRCHDSLTATPERARRRPGIVPADRRLLPHRQPRNIRG
mgnify:CR=1 FL=1